MSTQFEFLSEVNNTHLAPFMYVCNLCKIFEKFSAKNRYIF